MATTVDPYSRVMVAKEVVDIVKGNVAARIPAITAHV
jgi:hypothetical protein